MFTELTPRHLFRTALDLELQGARALATSAGNDDTSLEWIEHGNRLHVFSLFQYADVVLGRTAAADLPEMVERTWACTPYDRVWVIEGVGYLWGDRATGSLPDSALIPLHSGIGLSAARQVLQERASRREVDLAATLVQRCLDAAAPGFECVTVEAIGVAVRNLHPRLSRGFDEVLLGSDGILRACFWHGLGRGAYFATSNWRPASKSGAFDLENLRGLATDELARSNVLAGFAWAATLVNLHTPGVLARYLRALQDEDEAAAFAEGVRSSLTIWRHCAPDDDGIATLLACEPHDGGDGAWHALVRSPAEEALRQCAALAVGGRLPQLFHWGGA